MIVYIILAILLLFLTILELLNRGVHISIRLFLVIVLTSLMGFRNDVGNDYQSYVGIYRNLDWYSDILEIGFYYLCYYADSYGASHQFVFLVCSMLIMFPIAFVVNKIIPKFFCTAMSIYVFSYVYFEAMNTMRQAVAMSFFLLSFYYLVKVKKNMKAILAICAGFLFHKSIFIISVIACLFWCLKSVIGSRLCFLAQIASIIVGSALSVFSDYLAIISLYLGFNTNYFDSFEQRGVSGGTFQIYLNLSVLYLIIFKRKLFSHENELNKIVVLYYILSVLIYNIFISFYIGLRFYWYFYIFLILLIPILVRKKRLQNRPLYFIILIFIMTVYTFVSLCSEDYINYDFNFSLFN